MTIENATVVDMPASGQVAAPADADSNDLETRHAGILDLDNVDSVAPEGEGVKEPESTTPEGEETPERDAIDPWQTIEGYEDFEHDGKVWKIPSELKDGYLRQADYTRKTQAVAERTKALDTREQQLTQRYEMSEQEFEARAAMQNVSAQLKEFENFNWSVEAQKVADDPIARLDLQEKWRRFQELQGYQQQFGMFLHNAAQQRTEQAKQDTAKRLQETRAYAQTLKGWTPDLDNHLTNWAEKELGFDRDTLASAYNPQVYRALFGAYQWEQSQKRQQTARPSPTTPPPTPLKTVSAKASPNPHVTAESARSMEEYVRARSAGKL